MAGRYPEARVRTPVMLQSWREVSFLHWRVDPSLVASLLPPGLAPQQIDDSAWATIVAFRVEGARLFFGAPYFLSDMAVASDGPAGKVRYRSTRRPLQPAARHDLVVAPGDPMTDDERTDVDDLLTGRWRAYTRRAGRLMVAMTEHQPWPLHRAEAVEVDQTLSDAAGLGALRRPDLVHYSPGVDVRLSRPTPGGPRRPAPSTGR